MNALFLQGVSLMVHVEANAKINIGLIVGDKRSDGYHDLETIMARISLSDYIDMEIHESESTSVKIMGNDSYLAEGMDLMEKGALFFSSLSGHDFSLSIWIDKHIPAGAGLGGGSSDAASVITALNAYFDNPIEHDELTRLSVDVGSDVPFFVSGFRGALVTGKGECVRECAVPHGSAVTLFLPRSRMETSGAYKALDAIRRPQRHLPLLDGVSPTRRTHPNDFEHLYNVKFPLCDRKDDYPYVSLTGSGSAWYMLSSTPSEMVEDFTDYDILSQYFVI